MGYFSQLLRRLRVAAGALLLNLYCIAQVAVQAVLQQL
jgi:hypothetical protein